MTDHRGTWTSGRGFLLATFGAGIFAHSPPSAPSYRILAVYHPGSLGSAALRAAWPWALRFVAPAMILLVVMDSRGLWT